jgi:hypothetical protein
MVVTYLYDKVFENANLVNTEDDEDEDSDEE